MANGEQSLQHRYIYDHDFLDSRFGAPPISTYLGKPTLTGVSRLTVLPSFSPESVYTLLYGDVVDVIALVGTSSLWESLYGGPWTPPTERRWTVPLAELPELLSTWLSLKDAAISAPSVETAVIDGLEHTTLDGISFRHRICDQTHDVRAAWANPSAQASNHVEQVRLVRCYLEALNLNDVIEW